MKKTEIIPMTIEQCYEDKNAIVDMIMCKAFSKVAKAIDSDSNYSLSTGDEAELIYEFMEMWIKDTNK